MHPHNSLLQLALEWGIPGLLITLILAAALVVSSLRWARGSWAEHPERSSAMVALWAGVAIFIASLVDGPFYHSHSSMLIAVLVPIAAPGASVCDSRSLRWPTVLAVLLGPVTIIGLHFFVIRSQRAPVPPPDGLTAAIVRTFPSNIDGAYRWGIAWAREDPRLAIDWLHWGHGEVSFRREWKYQHHGSMLLYKVGAKQDSIEHARRALAAAQLGKWKKKLKARLERLESAGRPGAPKP